MTTVRTFVRRGFTTALVFISFAGAAGFAAAPRPPFTQIVAFGDSLSDNGNLFALTGGAIPPASAYAGGRFSNGPVWIEQVAAELGLSGRLADFAFGGACSGHDNYVGFEYKIPHLPGLAEELDLYTAASGGRADPDALYVVAVGANDIFLWAESGMPTSLADFATGIAANVSAAVTRLHQLGARHILVSDVADIGLTPYGLGSGLAPQLTGVSVTVNAAVDMALDRLACRGRIPTARFSMFAGLQDIVAAPADYGFAVIDVPYLAVGAGDPDTFLFWDSVHPTTAGHAVLAEVALDALREQHLLPPATPRRHHGPVHAGCGRN